MAQQDGGNTFTNFPNGLTSFGLPIIGAAPAIPVGMDSMYWFVDPSNGSDAGDGTVTSPFKTITKAYAQLRSGHWDGIFLIGYGSGSASADVSVPLVWAVNYAFLVGLCAPTLGQQRARISNGASTTLVTPLVEITGVGNIFKNIEFFNGGNHATSAAVCVSIDSGGQRNYFENCQFAGGGTTASAGNAAMRSLVINGGGENEFVHCCIGLDTILRNAATSELEIKGASPRNVFEGCLFDCNGAATALFFTMGAASIDRYTLFNGCSFYNFTGGGGATLTASWSINASAGGDVLMRLCFVIGATRTASTLIWADPAEGAAAASMKAVNPS